MARLRIALLARPRGRPLARLRAAALRPGGHAEFVGLVRLDDAGRSVGDRAHRAEAVGVGDLDGTGGIDGVGETEAPDVLAAAVVEDDRKRAIDVASAAMAVRLTLPST